MSMDISDLRFDALFEKAIQEWPATLNLEITDWKKNHGGRFAVEGLGELADDIGNAYIKHPNQIICRWLHSAIRAVIRHAAANIETIEIRQVRRQAVREYFEDSIKRQLKIESGWNKEERELVYRYFEAQGTPLTEEEKTLDENAE